MERVGLQTCADAVEVELYIAELGEEGRHVTEARACLEKLGKVTSDAVGKKGPPRNSRGCSQSAKRILCAHASFTAAIVPALAAQPV